jgi:Starch-binding associating with outer membrane
MNIQKNKYLLLFSFMLILVSCDKMKDFGDTNVDPNKVIVPSTPALLTNVLSQIGAVNTNAGYFCQYFAETQYPGNSIYAPIQLNFDGTYAGPMYDCQTIINFNSDPKTALVAAGNNFVNGTNANQIATARILKAWYSWTVTDTWGDVPYSQALLYPITTPKYDTQEEIYKGILAELKSAINQFDNGPVFKGDIVYGGNTQKWKKFANSLRLLVSLRMSKIYPGVSEYAAVEFRDALQNSVGLISSNADNFKIQYPGGAFPNPWNGQYAGGRKDLGESEPFVTLLTSLGDARQNQLKYGSSLIGVPYGRNRNYMNNSWGSVFDADKWSRVLGNEFRVDNAALSLVHSALVYFARAEAKEIGWTASAETLTAKELYEAGITASYEQWSLSPAAASAYISGPSVVYNGTNSLYKINLQRYIALYPDGLQGWSEYKRTGVPALVPAIDALNGGRIPRRFVYGPSEYNTNGANVNAAVARVPVYSETARMWWDKL